MRPKQFHVLSFQVSIKFAQTSAVFTGIFKIYEVCPDSSKTQFDVDLLQSNNQHNGNLPSVSAVGSAGSSAEGGSGQSSSGDGVEGEEQEESSSSHVVSYNHLL